MIKVLKENLSKYFDFDEDVVFGTVSYGGCRCLEKKYTSTMRKQALNDGFYILGLCSKNGGGYSPVLNVEHENNRHEYIYVIGEYKNGKMHEIITDREIKHVNEVDVMHFKASRSLVRFSNNIWQEFPVIGDKEFEPGYYFSDLCYVNCNKLNKKDIVMYLNYFKHEIDLFIGNYNNVLDNLKKYMEDEYDKINDAYTKVNECDDDKISKVHTKIIAHKYGVK